MVPNRLSSGWTIMVAEDGTDAVIGVLARIIRES